MHTILDVFEYWPDCTTDNRVTCLDLIMHLLSGELLKYFYDLLALR